MGTAISVHQSHSVLPLWDTYMHIYVYVCVCISICFADKLQNDHVKVVTNTIVKLQDFVSTLTCLKLDTNEFAYLKTIVLFSPGKQRKYRV